MLDNQGIDSLIGRTFNGYRVTRFIARGGMGVVFEARQESLDRPVAIKFLYPHLSGDPSFRERFEREARAVARLNHPNIVRVLDYGADGQLFYMVMDLVEGESLRERLARVHAEGLTLKTDTIISIAQQVGSALSHAHRLGYIHRDVKPGNILLARDGRAFLTDFGVVKILGDNQVTAAGVIIGTPEYMAPEQSSGESAIGPAADLYSLAVVTYEMMVGRVPFQAPTPVAVMRMHATEAPPLPSSLIPWFHPQIEAVLMRALAKDPADRYPSVDAFLGSLLLAANASHQFASGAFPM
ncbi:MAG: serine/threonine protein kinase, partial [Thermomicrobiaceae bacterium]|nr:serine/threonine protein kinase [Thermomicrobiaceae bacterium]